MKKQKPCQRPSLPHGTLVAAASASNEISILVIISNIIINNTRMHMRLSGMNRRHSFRRRYHRPWMSEMISLWLNTIWFMT
jgi:hypothetical protein